MESKDGLNGRMNEDGLNCDKLLKNAHLRRSIHPSSLGRIFKYASLLRISRALRLGIFDQPEENDFFNRLVRVRRINCGLRNSKRNKAEWTEVKYQIFYLTIGILQNILKKGN
jgi:hypothetical protein